jgi:trigger factor
MNTPKEELEETVNCGSDDAETRESAGTVKPDSAAEVKNRKKTADDSQKTEPDKNEKKKTGKEKEKKEEQDSKNDLIVKFSIEVPKEEIDKKFEETAVKYAGEAKLAGFRKGKIPIEVVKSRFKEAITDEVVNKAIEEAVYKRIDKDKLKIAAVPGVEKIDHKEGENLKADIEVEIFPEITLPDLEKIEIQVPALVLEEYNEKKQVDAFLEENRRRSPVTKRDIKEKDQVSLKYQSKLLDTKRMTPKKEVDYTVSKEGEFEIPELYKDLVGKKLNDRITVKRKYPEDYKKKIWAGKELEHYIEIEGIFELVKPTIDKDFLQKIGFSDEEAFKKQLKSNYEQYEKNQRENKISQLIVDKLIEVCEFPVPQSLVEQEVAQFVSQYAQTPINLKDNEEARKILAPLKPQAEKSIKFSLIVDSVKEEFKIEVTSDELETEYKKIAEKNSIPVKDIRKYYLNSKKDLQSLKESILKEKVMDFLKEKIKIKEV